MRLLITCAAADRNTANAAAASLDPDVGPDSFSVALSTNSAQAAAGTATPTHYAGLFANPTQSQLDKITAYTATPGAIAAGRRSVQLADGASVDAALAGLGMYRIQSSGPVIP